MLRNRSTMMLVTDVGDRCWRSMMATNVDVTILVINITSPISIGFKNQSKTSILTHPYMVASRGFVGD